MRLRPTTVWRAPIYRGVAALAAGLLLAGGLQAASARAAADPCGVGSNPIVCENSKPGSPPSEWDVTTNSTTIEGYASGFSYNVGDTVNFKIRTDATAYTIDIYRMGYYGGDGARKIASISPSAHLPQTQPACLNDATTGLIDCGNWATSATWIIPATAVSGIYFAHIMRSNGDENHILFVVRNDASTSDLLFETSDTTWQAYNNWGGNSLYTGSPDGRAYKVSYNRPFNTRSGPGGRDFAFANEYPMVRFLERNGYDVSYFSGIDGDRYGSLIKNHKVFLSVGHDEYWSGQQRANVEAARDAGVNIAFFSGNEVFWKTRWESSIDGTGAPYRTLVTYKETHANAKIDPSPLWTGTWRDIRFSPPGDARPENSLTGTFFTVNCCTYAIQVPAADGKLRLWRNTSVATLANGATATMPDGTLGYEWDEDIDNGSRPAGLFDMSSATYNVDERFTDYGNTVAPGVATHHLTMYRAPSGALVFGAGTVQWSWSLDDNHDAPGTPPPTDVRMQQATVNLLADMHAQPLTLMSGLTLATASTDTSPPTATITSPAPGTTLANGSQVTVTGTATDAGGGQVAGIEVSVDGGTTWHPASGRASWTYTYSAIGSGAVTIRARAVDDSGNLQPNPTVLNVNAACPCTLFGASAVPTNPADTDTTATELGVKFVPSITGWVKGVRFYKGTGNTGTHTGSLWTTSGTRLATAAFTGESASGWQEVDFSSPVPVTAGNTYIVSYFAPNGHYAADAEYFRYAPKVTPPLTAPQGTDSNANGVYKSGSAGFPDSTYKGANYWVDPVFDTTAPPDVTPPSVVAVSPLDGSTSVPLTMAPSATFSEPVVSSSISMTLKTAANVTVAGTTAYDAARQVATFTPAAALATSTDYTLTVSGAKDPSGNVMTTFTSAFRTASSAPVAGDCPCSIWSDSSVPAVTAVNDPSEVEVGVKFRTDSPGYITGIRFYKGGGNTGTHIGTLWSSTGAELASATFTGESTTGWQQVNFPPVAVAAGTTYVASYHTTTGFYSADSGGLSSDVVNGPLTALRDGSDGGNGVYRYGARGFPSTGGSANYWVDVVFTYPADTTPPTIASTSPSSAATSVPVSRPVSVTFSEKVVSSSVSFSLKDATGATVAGTGGFPVSPSTYVFTPSSSLAAGATYTATVSGAKDQAGNTQTSPLTWSFTTSGANACPCTLFPSDATPTATAVNDSGAVELGMKFTADVNGYVTGVRFYKGTGNTGTHIGNLWAADGTRLATATFGSESLGGWQSVTFAAPVPVTAGTSYIASYYAPAGHYAADGGYFATTGNDNSPLHAASSPAAGGNGVFAYGSSSRFPNNTYNSTNYWVDPIFTVGSPQDTVPPSLVSTNPIDGQTSVPPTVAPSATFDEALSSSGLSMTLTPQGGSAVSGTVSNDSASKTVTFTPDVQLAASTKYTVALSGVKDLAGNASGSTLTWSFTTASGATSTCPCTIWPDATLPAVTTVNDPQAVELGVKFRTDRAGVIRGVRFYKGPNNTGTHVGKLYASDGTLLASATFSNESVAGWQQVNFSSPVSVTANTTYVASYFAPSGFYSATTNGLSTAVDNAPLHALASGTDGPNGVYAYGSSGGYPTTGTSTNYWVDVVFSDPDTTPPAVTGLAASGSGSTATVTWSTDEPATSTVQYGTSATALTATVSNLDPGEQPLRSTDRSCSKHALLLPGDLYRCRRELDDLTGDNAGCGKLRAHGRAVHPDNNGTIPGGDSVQYLSRPGRRRRGSGHTDRGYGVQWHERSQRLDKHPERDRRPDDHRLGARDGERIPAHVQQCLRLGTFGRFQRDVPRVCRAGSRIRNERKFLALRGVLDPGERALRPHQYTVRERADGPCHQSRR